ncbi:MAG: helix-turn-helix domain-containing protein [Pseudonocardiales bacterium]
MVTKRRAALATARKAAGYTQEQLAAVLHVERSTVIRWEAGRHAPVPYLWPKLGRILGVSREQLQLLLAGDVLRPAPPAVCSPPTNQAVALEDIKRRTMMKWGVAATAAASLSASAGTAVGMADVKRLQRSTARLHSLDQQHGGDTLWRAALDEARDGMQLLEYGSYTGTVGQHLLTATGQLQICAGWLALDAGQHEVARSCFGEALVMSRQANDAQIETRALANLAFQSNVLVRPREALRYAAGAEHAATGHGSALWLAAIPQLRLAIGSSLAGNTRDADNALSNARRVLERDNEAANEEWAAFLSPMEIDGIEATCAIELQRPSHAERLLEQTIAGYATQFARNRMAYRVRLARARLDMRAVDGAAEAAHRALDDLTGEVASWRVLTELDAVAKRFVAYPEVDGVERFLVRYQTVNQ